MRKLLSLETEITLGVNFFSLSRVRRVEDLVLRSLVDVWRVNKGIPSGRDYLQEDNI